MAETVPIGPVTFVVTPDPPGPRPAPVRQPEQEERRCSAPLCTAKRWQMTHYVGPHDGLLHIEQGWVLNE